LIAAEQAARYVVEVNESAAICEAKRTDDFERRFLRSRSKHSGSSWGVIFEIKSERCVHAGGLASGKRKLFGGLVGYEHRLS
jgi:hypothetical protein